MSTTTRLQYYIGNKPPPCIKASNYSTIIMQTYEKGLKKQTNLATALMNWPGWMKPSTPYTLASHFIMQSPFNKNKTCNDKGCLSGVHIWFIWVSKDNAQKLANPLDWLSNLKKPPYLEGPRHKNPIWRVT